jgi:hypothetical protein
MVHFTDHKTHFENLFTILCKCPVLSMPVPSQGHYGFHSFPIVDWFCLFIYLWVLPFPLLDCSEFELWMWFKITYHFVRSGLKQSSLNKRKVISSRNIMRTFAPPPMFCDDPLRQGFQEKACKVEQNCFVGRGQTKTSFKRVENIHPTLLTYCQSNTCMKEEQLMKETKVLYWMH